MHVGFCRPILAEIMEQQQQQQVQSVKVTVRNGRQEQQELFQTPVDSSHVHTTLELVYGPGVLRLESSNMVLAPTAELQPAEGYVYVVAAGVWTFAVLPAAVLLCALLACAAWASPNAPQREVRCCLLLWCWQHFVSMQ